MSIALLSMVTNFAGPLVDLLIMSMGWDRVEREKLQGLKKQILRTLTDSIDHLEACRRSLSMRRQLTRQWLDLAVDLESYPQLQQRVAEFARATELSAQWNCNQRIALAIRLSAFRASILKTSSLDLKKVGKNSPGTERTQKQKPGRRKTISSRTASKPGVTLRKPGKRKYRRRNKPSD